MSRNLLGLLGKLIVQTIRNRSILIKEVQPATVVISFITFVSITLLSTESLIGLISFFLFFVKLLSKIVNLISIFNSNYVIQT